MAHAIFRSDSCSYTHDGSLIRTVVVPADMDNCTPIVLGGLTTVAGYSGEREVFSATPATDGSDAWILASVEVDYVKYGLDQFSNQSGKIGRAVKLTKPDIFSVTSEALSAIPSGSNIYVHTTATGLTVNSASASAFAKYLGTDDSDGTTWYGFDVL